MEDKLIMTKRERERKVVLEEYKAGYKTLKEAAVELDVSYRQAKRIWRRYRCEGDAGLVHKLRGKPSGRGYDPIFKQGVIDLFKKEYAECWPRHASEQMLENEGIEMHPETLRLWLLAEGLWQRQRRRKQHRQRRERCARFGEMLQIDGSTHQWIKGHKNSCLLNITDDATNITYAQIDNGETTKILFSCMLAWFKQYGIPKSVYVDLKTVYFGPKDLSAFQQLCKRLGIKIIKAHPPQAKGRVERKHADYQNRLPKELKRHNIATIDEANRYLRERFLGNLNQRMAKQPASTEDAHRPADCRGKADDLVYWVYTRVVQNDWTIRFNKGFYQIKKTRPLLVRPKHKIEVRRFLDERILLYYDGASLPFATLDKQPPKPPANQSKPYTSAMRSDNARRCKHRSPWSAFNPNWLKENKRA